MRKISSRATEDSCHVILHSILAFPNIKNSTCRLLKKKHIWLISIKKSRMGAPDAKKKSKSVSFRKSKFRNRMGWNLRKSFARHLVAFNHHVKIIFRPYYPQLICRRFTGPFWICFKTNPIWVSKLHIPLIFVQMEISFPNFDHTKRYFIASVKREFQILM